ncbi:hypothetical protein MUK42_19645 [Musa troglodytarum]|uniref:Uncharacterized protein n=1 Tax=Musa troglodytarum TaxID=320322 RepID=A0A9E7G1W6_9LILI|nr:hypothetical protein MUK42_19645 [Musa troglodytarum]
MDHNLCTQVIMVPFSSSRRKKHVVLPEGGQRRSARLQALEEEKAANAAASTTDAVQPSNAAQTSTRKRGRKKKEKPAQVASSSDDDWPEPSGVQRRDTYRPWNDSSEAIVSMALEQPKELVYNNSGLSYRESLLRFVRDAGPKAKMAAQMKLQQSWVGWHDPHASSSATGEAGPSSSTNAEDDRVMKGPICELETDELLRRFTVLGTAGVPEGTLAASSEQRVGGNASLASPVTAAAPPKRTFMYDLSFWESKLKADPSYATTQGPRRDAS